MIEGMTLEEENRWREQRELQIKNINKFYKILIVNEIITEEELNAVVKLANTIPYNKT